jgi:hypothetical protein
MSNLYDMTPEEKEAMRLAKTMGRVSALNADKKQTPATATTSAQREASVDTIACFMCGAQCAQSEDAKFCQKCGSPLDANATSSDIVQVLLDKRRKDQERVSAASSSSSSKESCDVIVQRDPTVQEEAQVRPSEDGTIVVFGDLQPAAKSDDVSLVSQGRQLRLTQIVEDEHGDRKVHVGEWQLPFVPSRVAASFEASTRRVKISISPPGAAKQHGASPSSSEASASAAAPKQDVVVASFSLAADASSDVERLQVLSGQTEEAFNFAFKASKANEQVELLFTHSPVFKVKSTRAVGNQKQTSITSITLPFEPTADSFHFADTTNQLSIHLPSAAEDSQFPTLAIPIE